MTITSRAVLRAHPDRRDEFVDVAQALAAAAAGEAGTLRYDWFTSGHDPDVFVALEEYADWAAAMEHNEHCGELLARAAELADFVSVDIYGELNPQIEQWVAEHPFAGAYGPLDHGGTT